MQAYPNRTGYLALITILERYNSHGLFFTTVLIYQHNVVILLHSTLFKELTQSKMQGNPVAVSQNGQGANSSNALRSQQLQNAATFGNTNCSAGDGNMLNNSSSTQSNRNSTGSTFNQRQQGTIEKLLVSFYPSISYANLWFNTAGFVSFFSALIWIYRQRSTERRPFILSLQ